MYSDDERDRSRFFVVYETGDNTTVSLGEATPLNLYYSRALNGATHTMWLSTKQWRNRSCMGLAGTWR